MGRYWYSTVGYGVTSIMGHLYATGRIEIYDSEDQSGFAIDEGAYWIPLKDEERVRDFFDFLETDMPIYIKVGQYEDCQQAVSDETGIPIDKFQDSEVVKSFFKKQYNQQKDKRKDQGKENG